MKASAPLTFFADRVEGNLLAAHLELQKLALLHPQGILSYEQIEAAVLNVARFDVFKLGEAVLAGQVGRALRMLEGLEAEGEAAVLVHWTLAEDIRALKRIKDAMADGKPLPLALKEARVWGVKERLFERVAAAVGRPPAGAPGASRERLRRRHQGLEAPGLAARCVERVEAAAAAGDAAGGVGAGYSRHSGAEAAIGTASLKQPAAVAMFPIRPFIDADWPTSGRSCVTRSRAATPTPSIRAANEADIKETWTRTPAATFVACDNGDRIIGTYFIKPNQPGPGLACMQLRLRHGRQRAWPGRRDRVVQTLASPGAGNGFSGQCSSILVVATNEGAVRLWQKLGFTIVGRLPGAFAHRQLGDVEALVMFKTLTSIPTRPDRGARHSVTPRAIDEVRDRLTAASACRFAATTCAALRSSVSAATCGSTVICGCRQNACSTGSARCGTHRARLGAGDRYRVRPASRHRRPARRAPG